MKKIFIFLIFFSFSFCSNDQEENDQQIIDDEITQIEDQTIQSDHLITTSPNGKVSSLLMTLSEYNDWKSNDQFTNTSKREELFKDIYKHFSDKYDFIFLVLNEDDIPENINYYGMLIDVSNSISGIGLDKYDYSARYGSSGKLKAVMQLTGLAFLKNGPALHELMHNWGNYSLPSENVDEPGSNLTSYPYYAHWGFTGGSSRGQLGGFNQNSLKSLGSNRYSVDPFGAFANGGNSVPFNEFELYLMGMAPISSVKSFDLFGDITSWEPSETKFDFKANSRITYNQEAIINLLGPRVPDSTDSQKEFNLLVVVLTDTELTEIQWDTINSAADWFSFNGSDNSFLFNFHEATNGSGKILIGE